MFGKKARLIVRTHFFSDDEYECSACGYRARKPFKVCPRCGARMNGSREDPTWIDEMEYADEIFGDWS
ncbi:MAG: hypothetical protein K5637_00795 [Lachnospiraceae bacterium]|nr:hypothetical protein [Lachnospiraceae bacterium]